MNHCVDWMNLNFSLDIVFLDCTPMKRERTLSTTSTTSSSQLSFNGGSSSNRSKKNADFHALFRSIPVTDTYIEGTKTQILIFKYFCAFSGFHFFYRIQLRITKRNFIARKNVSFRTAHQL